MKLLFDIETNGIEFESNVYWLDQDFKVLCVVIKDVETNRVTKYYDTDSVRELGTASIKDALKLLEQADELIGHNILAFDIPVLEKLFGFTRAPRIFDTLVVSRFLYTDRSGGHSLESYGERLGFPKLVAPGFDQFTRGLLTYCERDVELNHRVYELLLRDLAGGKLDEPVALEHDIARIIHNQERYGFYFKKEEAEALVQRLAKEIQDMDARLTELLGKRVVPKFEVKKPFNINGALAGRTVGYCEKYSLDQSLIAGPFQLFDTEEWNYESDAQKKVILERLGWKPTSRTKTGGPKMDESILQVGEVGTILLRRNVLGHRRSQVAGWVERCDANHRVHGGANPCGTNTHRMRHRVIVNVPKVSKPFGQQMRELFTVPQGKILAGYDAKQLELRVLAHYIGDQEYVGRVTTTDKSRDAHTLAAQAAGSGDRDLGKGINYALIYGAGDRRLGELIGGSEADGARVRAELYRSIPGLERLVRAAKDAARRGHVIGLDGRKFFIRTVLGSPLNTIIQGGGSVYMKRVCSILDGLLSHLPGYHKVIDMHDEAQWEIPDTEADRRSFHEAVSQSFVEANKFYNLRCPQEPDVKYGHTWAETH